MIFRDNCQKLLIYQSNDIWQYLAILNASWRHITTKNCHSKNIVTYLHLLPSGKRALKQNIMNLKKIIIKLMFSDKIIKGYWMKFMAINTVTDLKDCLLCFKKKKNEKMIFENSLTYIQSVFPGKSYTSFLIASSFQDAALIM